MEDVKKVFTVKWNTLEKSFKWQKEIVISPSR